MARKGTVCHAGNSRIAAKFPPTNTAQTMSIHDERAHRRPRPGHVIRTRHLCMHVPRFSCLCGAGSLHGRSWPTLRRGSHTEAEQPVTWAGGLGPLSFACSSVACHSPEAMPSAVALDLLGEAGQVGVVGREFLVVLGALLIAADRPRGARRGRRYA